MRSLSEPNRTTPLTVGFIPARWHSTRFEGKPLALINGVPMIQRVFDRACMSKKLDTIVVLTDDERISQYCSIKGIRCIVVDEECKTGTDRCSKVLELVDGTHFVNIQGDEPLINPDAIDKLIDSHDDNIGVTNAYVEVKDDYKLHDRNVVKTVLGLNNTAIYYSRYGIPFTQKVEVPFNQQLGLYMFDREKLKMFPKLKVGPLESAESVEMLRFLENGYDVKMVKVDDEGLSVDTPEDLTRVEKFINAFN